MSFFFPGNLRVHEAMKESKQMAANEDENIGTGDGCIGDGKSIGDGGAGDGCIGDGKTGVGDANMAQELMFM